jgi:hypothetical protein
LAWLTRLPPEELDAPADAPVPELPVDDELLLQPIRPGMMTKTESAAAPLTVRLIVLCTIALPPIWG